MSIIQGTTLTTISNLKRGDWAALFPFTTDLQRVLRAVPHGDRGIWITWDYGPGTRVRRQLMPANNSTQRAL